MLGIGLITVGVWAEVVSNEYEELVSLNELLYGPYLAIASGCALIVVSAIGIVGVCCETKINKFLLSFVSSLSLSRLVSCLSVCFSASVCLVYYSFVPVYVILSCYWIRFFLLCTVCNIAHYYCYRTACQWNTVFSI